jgi:Acetyltransferase (GNAT) domain
MTTQLQHPRAKLVEKLTACDFKIEAIDLRQPCSSSAKLQQTIFINELGFLKEVGEQADSYESVSARFVARVGDTPVGTLRLVNPQLGSSNTTLPIEAFLDVKPVTKGQPAMEISKFMLLPNYQGRAFCSAMMACCLSYAEQNTIAYAFAFTVPSADKLFEKVGFQAFAKPFFNPHCQMQVTPRVIDLKGGRKIIAELMKHLQEAKIIP